jgi:hypothetical protein
MFRVIVLGGLSLVSPAACSSTVNDTDASDVAPDFPSELPVFVDVPTRTDATDTADMGFPSELPAPVDAGPPDAAADAGSDMGFPSELPAPIDAGPETGFPLECPAGLVVCNAACVNLQTDQTNCGGCGIACTTSQVCLAGMCTTIDSGSSD